MVCLVFIFTAICHVICGIRSLFWNQVKIAFSSLTIVTHNCRCLSWESLTLSFSLSALVHAQWTENKYFQAVTWFWTASIQRILANVYGGLILNIPKFDGQKSVNFHFFCMIPSENGLVFSEIWHETSKKCSCIRWENLQVYIINEYYLPK